VRSCCVANSTDRQRRTVPCVAWACVREARLTGRFAFGHPTVTVLLGTGLEVYPLSKTFIGPVSPIGGWMVICSKINRLSLGTGMLQRLDTVVPTLPLKGSSARGCLRRDRIAALRTS